jgi:shikimate 5-dehydrogenase
MTYSIIGSGAVGTALARQFARSGVTVGIANTRGPDSMASLANELGNTVVPLTLQEALKADLIILAVPRSGHIATSPRPAPRGRARLSSTPPTLTACRCPTSTIFLRRRSWPKRCLARAS